MKKLFIYLIAILLTISVFAQSPERMSYQAIIRNASNNLLVNQTVGMKISILQASTNGEAVYVETQNPITNANGLISIEIGGGSTVVGDFAKIDWENGPCFLKTETDPEGGTNYSITGTSQLLSVPYVLHAKTAEKVVGGISETDPIFKASVANDISQKDVVKWDNKLDNYDETDSLFAVSVAVAITDSDTAVWNSKLESFDETDPLFDISVASAITRFDMANWNNKLQNFHELDPSFSASVAKGITTVDTSNWNAKLDSYTETDPAFSKWLANGGTATDTTISNNKPDYTETDPIFSKSIVGRITKADIVNWNNKLNSYEEVDSIFNNSVAGQISVADTSNWNGKIDSHNEKDPLFGVSVANKVTDADIAHWNNKLDAYTETDSLFSTSVSKGISESKKKEWNTKQVQLKAGTGIDIVGNTINATGSGNSTRYIGELYAGGVVFWVDHTGQHGLVVSMIDISVGLVWSNVSTVQLNKTNDWDGATNTKAIINQEDIVNGAARLCDFYCNLDFGTGTYNDWYLPSIAEMRKISKNFYEVQKTLETDGNPFTTHIDITKHYWTSTEDNRYYSWYMDFGLYESASAEKREKLSVRAVRAF